MTAPPATESVPLLKAPRLEFVDGLRALCAIYVVLHHIHLHVWLWTAGPQNDPVGFARITKILQYGSEAVVAFIVISGFCLMLPILNNNGQLRNGSTTFFYRRAHRLLPPYLVALIISAILGSTLLATTAGSLWDTAIPFTPKDLLTHVLLIQNFTAQEHKVNYVFWSIAIEWQIYFAFPLLAWVFRRFGIACVLMAAFAIATPIALLLPATIPDAAHVRFLNFFAFGMLAAWAMHRLPKTPRNSRLLAGILALSVGLRLASPLFHFDNRGLFIAALTASLLAYVSTVRTSLLHKLLTWKPLVTIGVASYSLYLLHPLCIELARRYIVHPLALSKNKEFLVLLAVASAFCAVATFLFFHAIEKPFLNPRSAKALQARASAAPPHEPFNTPPPPTGS